MTLAEHSLSAGVCQCCCWAFSRSAFLHPFGTISMSLRGGNSVRRQELLPSASVGRGRFRLRLSASANVLGMSVAQQGTCRRRTQSQARRNFLQLRGRCRTMPPSITEAIAGWSPIIGCECCPTRPNVRLTGATSFRALCIDSLHASTSSNHSRARSLVWRLSKATSTNYLPGSITTCLIRCRFQV